VRTRNALTLAAVSAAFLILSATASAATVKVSKPGYYSLKITSLPAKTTAQDKDDDIFYLKIGGSKENTIIGSVLYARVTPSSFLKKGASKDVHSVGGGVYCGRIISERGKYPSAPDCARALPGGLVLETAVDIINADPGAEIESTLKHMTGTIYKNAI
jgi:hypothetical protein